MGPKIKRKFAATTGPSFVSFLTKHQNNTSVVKKLSLGQKLKVFQTERKLIDLAQWDQVEIREEKVCDNSGSSSNKTSSSTVPGAASSSSSQHLPNPSGGELKAVKPETITNETTRISRISVGGTHSVTGVAEFFEPTSTDEKIPLDGRDRGIALVDDDGGVVMLRLESVDPVNRSR